jgi:hypothetical protein
MKINKVRPSWLAATAIFGMATLALGAAPAVAKSTGGVQGNKLQCFDGPSDETVYGGQCTLTADGAVLNNTDGDLDGSYSGVYLQQTNLGGKTLSAVNQLAFSFTSSDVSGGSPRVSLPIDTNSDGQWDDFAFMDAMGCNDGAGTVDIINDPTCLISFAYATGSYENWAAFAAANPSYRIADDTPAFVIADQPGSYTISNVRLGKGPAKGR